MGGLPESQDSLASRWNLISSLFSSSSRAVILVLGSSLGRTARPRGKFGDEKRTASTQYRRATTEKACGGGILIMSYGGNADPNGVQVTFLDQTGSKSVKAVIAFTVPVSRIIPNIITKMNLPATSPDGQPMSYALDHKEGGRRLLENWTLVEAGIQNGDHLIVYPEVVAGCG